MAIEFKLPEVSDGVKTVDIAEIKVKAGDVLTAGQVVMDLETEKAVVELECPHAGTVTKVHVSAGQSVAIGTPLLSIEIGASSVVPQATVPTKPATAIPVAQPIAAQPAVVSKVAAPNDCSQCAACRVRYSSACSRRPRHSATRTRSRRRFASSHRHWSRWTDHARGRAELRQEYSRRESVRARWLRPDCDSAAARFQPVRPGRTTSSKQDREGLSHKPELGVADDPARHAARSVRHHRSGGSSQAVWRDAWQERPEGDDDCHRHEGSRPRA